MLDATKFNSYGELARAAIQYARKAKQKLSGKLFYALVAADVAARKDQRKRIKKAIKVSENSIYLEGNPQFVEALRELLSKIPVTSEKLALIESKYRRLVFGTKSLMGLDDSVQFTILAHIKNLIDRSMQGEITYAEFAEQVAAKAEAEGNLVIPEHRLELIFHQNVIQAYNAGSYDQLYEQMEGDQELVFRSSKDERVDADLDDEDAPCLSADGFVAPKSDPAWETLWPPLHFGCRCGVSIALDQDRASPSRKESVDLSLVPEAFRNSPANGFNVSAPSAASLEEVIAYLYAFERQMKARPEPTPEQETTTVAPSD